MSTAIPGVTDWRQFEDHARRYFSQLWDVDLQTRTVQVAQQVDWKFDATWLKNIPDPAAGVRIGLSSASVANTNSHAPAAAVASHSHGSQTTPFRPNHDPRAWRAAQLPNRDVRHYPVPHDGDRVMLML